VDEKKNRSTVRSQKRWDSLNNEVKEDKKQEKVRKEKRVREE
jgi:hypothetical protein